MQSASLVQAAPQMRPHVVCVATFICVISFIRSFSWYMIFFYFSFAIIQKTSQPLCLFVCCITTKPSSSHFISTVPALKRPFYAVFSKQTPDLPERKKKTLWILCMFNMEFLKACLIQTSFTRCVWERALLDSREPEKREVYQCD